VPVHGLHEDDRSRADDRARLGQRPRDGEIGTSGRAERTQHGLEDSRCREDSHDRLLDAEALLRAPALAPLVPYPVEALVPDGTRQTPAVGQRATRPDARLHGLGQTKYIDDFYLPGMLYAKVKRAGVASRAHHQHRHERSRRRCRV
jgi:hypothetical protein